MSYTIAYKQQRTTFTGGKRTGLYLMRWIRVEEGLPAFLEGYPPAWGITRPFVVYAPRLARPAGSDGEPPRHGVSMGRRVMDAVVPENTQGMEGEVTHWAYLPLEHFDADTDS